MRPCGPGLVVAVFAGIVSLSLAGCGAPMLTIHGQLVLPEGSHPPPQALSVVELRDQADGRVLAEQRGPPHEAAAPLPFRLQLPREQLTAGHDYRVRGALLAQGWAQWLSEAVTIDTGRADIELGELRLLPASRPLAFQTRIDCAGRIFVVGMAGDTLQLRDGEAAFELRASAIAPDERLDAVGDAGTFVWHQGAVATVSVRGVLYHDCRPRGDGSGR